MISLCSLIFLCIPHRPVIEFIVTFPSSRIFRTWRWSSIRSSEVGSGNSVGVQASAPADVRGGLLELCVNPLASSFGKLCPWFRECVLKDG